MFDQIIDQPNYIDSKNITSYLRVVCGTVYFFGQVRTKVPVNQSYRVSIFFYSNRVEMTR